MLFKCPYPGCEHMGLVITKVHCENKHSTEKELIFEKYGKPEKVGYKPGGGVNKNRKR